MGNWRPWFGVDHETGALKGDVVLAAPRDAVGPRFLRLYWSDFRHRRRGTDTPMNFDSEGQSITMPAIFPPTALSIWPAIRFIRWRRTRFGLRRCRTCGYDLC